MLARLGFILGSSQPTESTLLDTFDGRLHSAGLRLQATTGERIELELFGQDTGPAHVTVPTLPRVVADLPPGPFRSRVGAVIDGRALMPHLHVRARVIPRTAPRRG